MFKNRNFIDLVLTILTSILLFPFLPASVFAISGDANGDGKVDGIDYVIWRNNYNKSVNQGASVGDFNSNGFVDGLDYVIWLNNYGKSSSVSATPTPVIPTSPAGPTSPPQTAELSIAVCDPANGPFSLNITNEYFPLPVGKQLVLENPTLKVQLTVLNQTEIVAGVTTRVFEEREWEGG